MDCIQLIVKVAQLRGLSEDHVSQPVAKMVVTSADTG